MSALTDFYDFYAPMRAKYGLRLTMSSNAKQTKITIYEGRKELVKVVEDEYDVCYIRAKRELEAKLKTRGENKCTTDVDKPKSHNEFIKEKLQKRGWEIT